MNTFILSAKQAAADLRPVLRRLKLRAQTNRKTLWIFDTTGVTDEANFFDFALDRDLARFAIYCSQLLDRDAFELDGPPPRATYWRQIGGLSCAMMNEIPSKRKAAP